MSSNASVFDLTENHDAWSFSQPFGPSSLYGRPPYPYRGARTITTVLRFDGEKLAPYLPPGVTLDGPEPIGVVAVNKYPETPFGAYQELSLFVKATAFGRPYMYSPLMYADGEGATASGRELWGFAKKVAQMNLVEQGNLWRFTAERRGQEICSLEFRTEQQASPEEIALVDFPTLTMRLIPSLTGRGAPDIAQLVSTLNVKRPHTTDGTIHRWAGTATVTMTENEADPLGPFRPLEILAAWMTEYDCDLPAGELVHDYVRP